MSFALGSLIILLLGLGLLAVGLRARRVGGEPHCRVCEYNLTGVVSRREGEASRAKPDPFGPQGAEPLLAEQGHTATEDAKSRNAARLAGQWRGSDEELFPGCKLSVPLCPECGTAVTRRTVRWGEKRRRLVMPTLGVLLLLAGAAGIYGNFDRNRWMRQYPYPAVLMFARNGDRDALRELHRRYKNVELSAAATRSLIEEALEMQQTDPAPANLADWLMLLDNFDTGNSFTPSQRQRYVEQVFHNVKLEPRTIYREGERLMATLEVELRAAGANSVAILQNHGAFGAGIRVHHDERERFSPIQTIEGKGQMILRFPALCRNSGTTDVTYEVRLSILGRYEEGVGKTILLAFPTRILPFGEGYQFKSAQDHLDSQLINAIAIKLHYSSTNGRSDMHQTQMEFYAKEVLPASLVADVVLCNGVSSFQVGTLMAWKGTKVIDARMDVDKLSEVPDGEIRLVLKHNPSVTHQTAGLDEVYTRELTLGPFRINRPPPQGSWTIYINP